MKKIALITGISGQDGSYLSELLLKKSYKVHGFVRPNYKTNSQKHNWRINHIKKKLILHKVSVNNHFKLKKLIKKINPTEVYHLAAQPFAHLYNGQSFKSDLHTFNLNFNYTHFLISSIFENNKKTKFFFAGSSEMYRENITKKISEKTIFEPRSVYGISKLASHYLIKNYRENYNMNISTGFLFNHESPRKDSNFVLRKISKSVARIKNGLQKEIKLGDIKSKRDWGHAKDFARAMWMICRQKKPNDFIVGTGKLHSVEDFVKLAFKHVNLNYKKYLKIDANFKRKKDSKAKLADINKIKRVLGWKPYINFKNLMKDMVDKDLENYRKK